MKIKVSNANTPNWKEVTVKSHIPEELKKNLPSILKQEKEKWYKYVR